MLDELLGNSNASSSLMGYEPLWKLSARNAYQPRHVAVEHKPVTGTLDSLIKYAVDELGFEREQLRILLQRAIFEELK